MSRRLPVFLIGVLAVVAPFSAARAVYVTPNGYYAVATGVQQVIPGNQANPSFFAQIKYATGGTNIATRTGVRQIAISKANVANLMRLNPTAAVITAIGALLVSQYPTARYEGSNWIMDTSEQQTVFTGTCSTSRTGSQLGTSQTLSQCTTLCKSDWSSAGYNVTGTVTYQACNVQNCTKILLDTLPNNICGQLSNQVETQQTVPVTRLLTDTELTSVNASDLFEAIGWPALRTLPEIQALEQQQAQATEAEHDGDPDTIPQQPEGVETLPEEPAIECTGGLGEPCHVIVKENELGEPVPPEEVTEYEDIRPDIESRANASPLSNLSPLPSIEGGVCTPMTWNAPITGAAMRFPSVEGCQAIDTKVKPMLAFILYIMTALMIYRAVTSRDQSAV